MKDLLDGLHRRATASNMVLLQSVLALLTAAGAWLVGWQAAVTGLALMHLVAVVVAVGPWSDRTHKARTTKQLKSLERRLDAVSARVIAGTERTRVDVLDAVSESRATAKDRLP